jgi:hypothetical protein
MIRDLFDHPDAHNPVTPAGFKQDDTHRKFLMSALRVLYLLRLLIAHRSLNLVQINQMLELNPAIGRMLTETTLMKHIQTIRQMGCCVPSATSKTGYYYHLLTYPFTTQLGETALHMMLDALGMLKQPGGPFRLADRYLLYLLRVSWVLPLSGRQQFYKRLLHVVGPDDTPYPNIWTLDGHPLQATLYRFNQAVAQNQPFILELLLPADEAGHYPEAPHCLDGTPLPPGKVIRPSYTVLYPRQAAVEKRHIVIEAYDFLLMRWRFIQLPVYARCYFLPPLSSSLNTAGTLQYEPVSIEVTFKLTGRLAQRYKLYPREVVVERRLLDTLAAGDQAEELVVRAATQDLSILLRRLARYGNQCRIIAPVKAVDAMRRYLELLYRLHTTPVHLNI